MWDIAVRELGFLSVCQSLVCCSQNSSGVCVVYGPLPYLVTFAAAKAAIQFYITGKGNVAHPKAVGKQISLNTISGHARLLLAAVNLHRILRAVENCLPQEVLLVDQVQVSPDPRGYV